MQEDVEEMLREVDWDDLDVVQWYAFLNIVMNFWDQ
jgi:hypothetical protein